jgi:hypothetical protein
MQRRYFKECAAISLLLCVASWGWSQTITASLEGIVKDPAGAVIPGASARIVNAGTNASVELKTDQDGRFFAPVLQPGVYSVTIGAAGFKRVERTGLRLSVAQAARIELAMEIGSLSESMSVSATAPLIDATSSSVGHVIESQRIVNLPLNQRNPYALVLLVPGVSGAVGSDQYGSDFSVNGGRSSSNDILLDGASGAVSADNSQRFSVFPSVDAVEEFRVQTNNYSAEFGSSGGGIVNLIYKSGTNQLHGSTFDFLRNSVMDANSWTGNKNGVPLASFKRNQFGASAGGPVMLPKLYKGRDRTFFFMDYEGLRQRSAGSFGPTTVPTLQQRAGDFSNTRTSSGAMITIYDPFSTVASVRTPMPGNVIPASRFNPVSAKVVKYWPEPNRTGDPNTLTNNFFLTGSNSQNIDQFDAKVDHNINDAQRLSVRISRRFLDAPLTPYFPAAIQAGQNGADNSQPTGNGVVNYTFTKSPTFLINVRYGFARLVSLAVPNGLGFDPTNLGLPAYVTAEARSLVMPQFSPSGYYAIGGGNANWGAKAADTQALQILNTKVTSRHSLKFGADLRLYHNTVNQQAQTTGIFSFNRNFTAGPNALTPVVNSGDGFASLLFGTASSGVTQEDAKNVAAQSTYYALYLADDWKLTPKLTLNLGLRYDLNVPAYERYNRGNYFSTSVLNPLGPQAGMPNLRGGVEFYDVGGNPRRISNTEWKDFAPRLGFAYQAQRDTVIRGAYGIFFAPPPTVAAQSLTQAGFSSSTPMVTSLDGGVTPYNTIDNPYPQGYLPITGSTQGLSTLLGQSVSFRQYGNRNPYVQEWNFGIQRAIKGGIVIDAAYVGSKGTYLVVGNPSSDLSLNDLPPTYLSQGNQLLQQVTNPFYGFISTGTLAQKTIQSYQLLRPFPQFTGVVATYPTGSNSVYDAFQLKAEKRFDHGISFLVSYTNGKSIDESSVDNSNFVGGAYSSAPYQNAYSRRSERSLSSYDISQRLVLNFVYDLPLGRSRAFGRNWNGAVDAMLGGWQLNGISTFQKGVPVALSATFPVSGIYGSALRPDNNGTSAKLSGPAVDRLAKYFNVSVFSPPPTFTLGTVSRTLPDVRTPGQCNFDLSLFKSFKPIEKLTMQLRWESFNAFNHPQFGNTDSNVNSVTFGRISTTTNGPRTTQLALKVLF